VAAAGTGNLVYQWLRNGTEVAGASSATFNLAAAQTGDTGIYTARISNAGGRTLSAPTLLTVSPAASGHAYEFVPAITTPGSGLPVQVIFDAWADTTSVQLKRPDNSLRSLTQIPGSTKWTTLLTEAETLSGLTGGFMSWLGTLSASGPSHSYTSQSLFQAVRTAAMPDVAVTVMGPGIQESPHLVNIQYDGQYSQGTAWTDVVQTFYQHYQDNYDFVVQSWLLREETAAYYHSYRNSILGTGIGVFDNSASGGAGGTSRVKGFVHFSPNSPVDLAQQVISHEIGHHVMNFVQGCALNSNTSHFPISTTAFGVMGLQAPMTNLQLTKQGTGNYLVENRSTYGDFNEYELYMLGLLPAAQVPDQVVFPGQTGYPSAGTVYPGPGTTVTIAQVIAANGARNPVYPNAPTALRVATLLMSRGRLLTPQEMALYDYMAARGEGMSPVDTNYGRPWYVCTGGRSTLTTTLH
jgi:hypothetical protein